MVRGESKSINIHSRRERQCIVEEGSAKIAAMHALQNAFLEFCYKIRSGICCDSNKISLQYIGWESRYIWPSDEFQMALLGRRSITQALMLRYGGV